MNIPYSDYENNLIKQYWTQKDGKEILVKLLPHRPFNSIRYRAYQLRLLVKIKATYDKEFFKEPNIVNSAIAGFIAADGCLSTKNRLIININRRDIDILNKIKQLTKYNGNILEYRKITNHEISDGKFIKGDSMFAVLSIWQCPEYFTDLNKHWNITSRKTYTLMPPNLNKLEDKLAYCSGNLCGDGWFNWQKRGRSKILNMYWSGTLDLIIWIKEVLNLLVKNNNKIFKSRGAKCLYYYGIAGSSVYILCKAFLSLNIPRIERKWQEAQKYVEFIENKGAPKINNKLKALLTPEVISFVQNNGSNFPDWILKLVEAPKNISQNSLDISPVPS